MWNKTIEYFGLRLDTTEWLGQAQGVGLKQPQ
jgi:hypothetical protein